VHQTQQGAQHALMQRLYSDSQMLQQQQDTNQGQGGAVPQPRSVRGGYIPAFTSQAVGQLANSPHSPFSRSGTGPLDRKGIGLAVQYIRDALECRKVQLRALSEGQRTVEQVISNFWYKSFMVLVILGQMYMAYSEHQDAEIYHEQKDSSHKPDRIWKPHNFMLTYFLRILILGVYIADISLEVYSRQMWMFVQSGWRIAYCVVVFAMLATVWGPYYYYLAFLRPVLLIAKVRDLRHVFTTIFKTLPRTANVTVLFFTIVFIYAGVGRLLFHGLYTPQESLKAGLNNGEWHCFDR
jgi:hypothetical protein